MFLIPSRAVLPSKTDTDNSGKFINFHHLNKEVVIPIANPNLFGRLEQDLDKARELQCNKFKVLKLAPLQGIH